jgi:hypothetical protein
LCVILYTKQNFKEIFLKLKNNYKTILGLNKGICSILPNAPPKFLDRLNCESKGENNGRRRSWGMLLACSTSKVKGRAGAPEWGLGRLTNNSITQTDLHKPNNKLVSA